jgi:hypothetical protein
MNSVKTLLLSILISVSSLSFATDRFIMGDLRTGDVLLQPLNCWTCSLIEAQDNTIYSHMGILIKMNGETYVFEAYGSVKFTKLNTFLKRTEGGQTVRVIRPPQFSFKQTLALITNSLQLEGSAYDPGFRWNNYDKSGKEKYYCSELVYKMFERSGVRFNDLEPKSMPFDVYPELWDKIFNGDTPRNKMGISPASFSTSSDFDFVMEI